MLEQELSGMDSITQLQDGIDQLLTIMASSIHYLVDGANFVQVSADIPITKKNHKAAPADEFEANKRELIDDLVRKVKQVEYLIQAMPVPEPEEEQVARLGRIEQEMVAANQEYREAVERAKTLHHEITQVLQMMLSSRPPS